MITWPDLEAALQGRPGWRRRDAGYRVGGAGENRRVRRGVQRMEAATNHAMGFRNSGAESLLTPFKKRRGGLI